MIFLCFSVKDRFPLVNDFYHFLSNFGIDIWYDRKNIYLGDNRENINIKNGAKNKAVNYAVIFYSNHFKDGNICLNEYEILVNRYKKNEIFLFPVFINHIPNKIDEPFNILKKLVYKEIQSQNDFLSLSLHIIGKITSDELCNTKYHTIKEIDIYKNDLYTKLLVEYQNIDGTNYNMRIAFLYSLYVVLSYKNNVSYFHYKTMNFIYHQNCLSMLIDEKRELQIMENIIIYEFSAL